MPINPFPSNYHFEEPTCSILSMDPNYNAHVFSWGAQFYQQPPNADYDGITTAQQMQEEYRDVCEGVRETMFEKPLTPSDVGKLNRLVIPKQHAERYFPLDGSGGSSAEPGEKGVQLSFEDEEGKQWRFRYSYWNSSQSYVLTKGWSRFVKEKRLDAGDIVSFRRERPRSGEKMFIGWRRRDAPAESSGSSSLQQQGREGPSPHQWGPSSYPATPAGGAAAHCIARQRDGLLHAGEGEGGGGGSRKPAAANSKRVRLFGVNLDCPAGGDDASDPEDPDLSPSDGGSGHHLLYSVPQFSSGSSSQT